MSNERLICLKDILLSAIECEMSNIYDADYEELGAAIDMLKDLEEAIYYRTVTEAMHGKDSEDYEREYNKKFGHRQSDDRMYYPMYDDEIKSHMMDGHMDTRDHREGKSHMSRRMYMEAKEMKKDKTTQLRELEKYMQELTSDMVDMIQDASSEEKQYLEKKISALAVKIGQMK